MGLGDFLGEGFGVCFLGFLALELLVSQFNIYCSGQIGHYK